MREDTGWEADATLFSGLEAISQRHRREGEDEDDWGMGAIQIPG
jgi:hypothetical protein